MKYSLPWTLGLYDDMHHSSTDSGLGLLHGRTVAYPYFALKITSGSRSWVSPTKGLIELHRSLALTIDNL